MPFTARGMQVGVTNAAIENFNRDILGPGGAPINGEGRKRRGGGLGGKSFDVHVGS
jgi:hypothetical protein